MFRRTISAAGWLLFASQLHGQAPTPPAVMRLPPSLSAGGTGVIVNGAAWGHVAWQATTPEWYAKNHIAVYLKSGDAASVQPFVLQGTVAPLTDPTAIAAWVGRAARLAQATDGLAENIGICKALAGNLIELWSPVQPAVIPGGLVESLSILAGRAAQEPAAAATLRGMGLSHPVFRFLSGTGWAGPLNVPVGQDATIELREVDRVSGSEGTTVARLTLRATSLSSPKISPDLVTAPDAVVQVKPDWFPTAAVLLPEGVLNIPAQTMLPDLAPALRWSFPDELRRQVLLTRGFMLWHSNASLTMPSSASLVLNLPLLTKILRNPAPAPKLFSSLAGIGSGPAVDNFTLDRTTWFFADDNQRYDFKVAPPEGQNPVITGTAHANNSSRVYYTAAVDLLGRYGPPSAPRAAVAIRTVPPNTPKIEAVENIVSGGNQRLRIAFKPTLVPAGGVPISRYLIFRDRAVNTLPGIQRTLNKSVDPARNNEMIYVGQVNQPPNPTALSEITFTDQALAPVLPAHFGQTYYYCLRAVCDVPGFGMNISAPSAPVFGTVRDREGPPAPSGIIAVEGARPGIAFADLNPVITDNPNVPADTTLLRFRFTRQSRGVASIRMRIVRQIAREGGSQTTNLPEFHFGKSSSFDFDYPVGGDRQDNFTLSVEAISANGRVSHRVTPGPFTLSDLLPRKTYVLEILSTTGGVMDMDPQFNFLWQPYFIKPSDGTPSFYSFAAVSLGDGTYTGTFPGPVDASRSRSLLIQRRSSPTGTWSNLNWARLPAGQSQFHFLVGGVFLPNAQYRVWEVIDPPGAPDILSFAHDPTPADASVVQPIKVTLIAPAGASEYRIYRRIENGPLFLLKQDAGTWDPATVKTTVLSDTLVPPAGGTFSYFGQTFDEHGNPSPLALLDQVVGVIPELPVPVVDVLESGGTIADPRLVVRASCPSPGVERAEIVMTPAPEFTTTLATKAIPNGVLFNFTPGASPSLPQEISSTALSSTVVTSSPAVPFIFSDSIRIKAGVEYTFQIRVLGIFGTTGTLSSEQKFTWTEPIAGSAVPWPARATPPAISWHPSVVAFRNLPEFQTVSLPGGTSRVISDITPGYRPVAVEIGYIPFNSENPRDLDSLSNWRIIFSLRAPDKGLLAMVGVPDAAATPSRLFHQFLHPKTKNGGDLPAYDYDRKLLPVVLYRQQTQRLIGSTSVPVVDADLVQVSPLIENIAYLEELGEVSLIDPYVGVLERSALIAGPPFGLSLCLFDCAPATAGASYRYFLVHFTSNYEPDAIINAGVVNIPANP